MFSPERPSQLRVHGRPSIIERTFWIPPPCLHYFPGPQHSGNDNIIHLAHPQLTQRCDVNPSSKVHLTRFPLIPLRGSSQRPCQRHPCLQQQPPSQPSCSHSSPHTHCPTQPRGPHLRRASPHVRGTSWPMPAGLQWPREPTPLLLHSWCCSRLTPVPLLPSFQTHCPSLLLSQTGLAQPRDSALVPLAFLGPLLLAWQNWAPTPPSDRAPALPGLGPPRRWPVRGAALWGDPMANPHREGASWFVFGGCSQALAKPLRCYTFVGRVNE